MTRKNIVRYSISASDRAKKGPNRCQKRWKQWSGLLQCPAPGTNRLEKSLFLIMERDNDVAELSIDEDTMCTSLLACIENIWISSAQNN